MKKILSIVAVCFALVAANAADFRSESFMNFPAVYVTNLMALTNLSTAGNHGTNVAGVAYTNAGARVVISATASTANTSASRRNLFHDVGLYANANGDWPAAVTNVGVASSYLSPVTLSVTATAGSGTVGALQFIFTPVYNGANESTEAAQQWTVGLVPVASTTQTLVTNVPVYLWPGAKQIRLRRVTNTATAASSDCIITDISLNGYIP